MEPQTLIGAGLLLGAFCAGGTVADLINATRRRRWQTWMHRAEQRIAHRDAYIHALEAENSRLTDVAAKPALLVYEGRKTA